MNTHTLFLLLCLLGLPALMAQEPSVIPVLTLDAAVERTLATHPEIAIQETAVDAAEGIRQRSGAWPNPALSYYREDLENGDLALAEWTLAAELPLNALWERWSRVASADARVEAERLRVADARRRLTLAVQQSYIDALSAQRMTDTWATVTAIFDRAVAAAEARFNDGDIARYALQRIRMERLRYRKDAADADALRIAALERLSLLMNAGGDAVTIDSLADLPLSIPVPDAAALQASALDNRPDLRAARRLAESREKALSAQKWGRLPELRLGYGYKEQSDDFTGTVLQVNAALPLFDRNQGGVTEAAAQRRRAELNITLLEAEVRSEVRAAHEQFRLYAGELDGLRHLDDDALTATLASARTAYGEGEMSLVELLDAVQAYVATRRARADLLAEFHRRRFALAAAAATSLTAR